MISIIAAVGQNGVIGKNGKLPWHLPADLKHFRELTTDKTVIMGRKTYESIGKPLPNRKNIIVTNQKGYQAHGCLVAHSVEEAMAETAGPNESFCIGGAEIYRQFLPVAEKIYLTKVNKNFDGDAFFPELDSKEWLEIEHSNAVKDTATDTEFEFITLQRKH